MNNLVIFYDISDNKVRRKTIKILESYGVRIQKSVFECFLNSKRNKMLEMEIFKLSKFLINDSLIILNIDSKFKKEYETKYVEEKYIDLVI